jgi:hypothetical protein
VQVHGTFTKTISFMLSEVENQPFKVLNDVVTLVTGLRLYIKWNTRYLVRYD